jgi:hypothetical protein
MTTIALIHSTPARAKAQKALRVAGGMLAGLVGLGWAGLQIQPAPFPAVPQPPKPPETMPLPTGLPPPVERFYRATYGEQVPRITSAVISGRGTMRPFAGISFPARFRFMHEAGRTFRAYFELTVFGLPIMKVDEHYVDGMFRQAGTPAGVEEGEPKLNHSANGRMWAEWATWLPAMLLTDPQARWEPIDDTTALLVVPFGQEQEHLIVRFDPATDKLQYVEMMKYKHASDTAKTLWINAIWFGDRPWAAFNIEDVTYNADVDTSFAARGAKPARLPSWFGGDAYATTPDPRHNAARGA